jgi:CRP/FNR family transcriptional regulator, cyclic AMP receptor protein
MFGQRALPAAQPLRYLSQEAAGMVGSAEWRSTVDDGCLEALRASFVEHRLSDGESLCTHTTAADSWIGVVSGLIKICSLSESGTSVTYAGLATGGWFGESAKAWSDGQRLQIVALRSSHLVLLPRHAFEHLLSQNPRFNRFVMERLQAWLGHFMSMVLSDRSFSNEQRVAHTLHALFDPTLCPGVGKVLQITQHEVGSLCGLSRQSTNRALQLLEVCGAIEISYGQIRVRSLERLRLVGWGEPVNKQPIATAPASKGARPAGGWVPAGVAA